MAKLFDDSLQQPHYLSKHIVNQKVFLLFLWCSFFFLLAVKLPHLVGINRLESHHIEFISLC